MTDNAADTRAYALRPVGFVRGGRTEPIDDGWDAVTATIALNPEFDLRSAGGTGRLLASRGRLPLPSGRRERGRRRRASSARTDRLAKGRHLRPARQGPPEPAWRDGLPPACGRRDDGSGSPDSTPSTERRCSTSSQSCAASCRVARSASRNGRRADGGLLGVACPCSATAPRSPSPPPRNRASARRGGAWPRRPRPSGRSGNPRRHGRRATPPRRRRRFGGHQRNQQRAGQAGHDMQRRDRERLAVRLDRRARRGERRVRLRDMREADGGDKARAERLARPGEYGVERLGLQLNERVWRLGAVADEIGGGVFRDLGLRLRRRVGDAVDRRIGEAGRWHRLRLDRLALPNPFGGDQFGDGEGRRDEPAACPACASRGRRA